MRRFKARVRTDWQAALNEWAPLMAAPATPFQSHRWLAGWYAHLATGPAEALPVEILDAASGALAMVLPLVRLRGGRVGGGRLTTIEFADRGITDYNLPILGPAAPADAAEAEAAMDAMRRALPAADLAVFTKMPLEIAGRPNPVVAGLQTEASSLFGNYVELGDSYEDWLRSLDKHDRKELARFWRVFTREEGATFQRVTDLAEARRVFAWLERNQGDRIRAKGLEYLLDDPAYAGIYRSMLEEGLADGSVILTALTCGEEIVAALYGVCDGTHYAMVRLALTDDHRWSNASPGRLLIERSIEVMHREGLRWFDFTIGDYLHKRGFAAKHTPLADTTFALSLRGLPTIGLRRAKTFVKSHPELEKIVRKVMHRAA